MGLYDDFFGNVKDKMIDGAVDRVIDNAKGKATLAKTYVWTCINKETHNSVVANLTFINKLGQRRRVPYAKLEEFCATEYVSNVIAQDGQIKMIGCNLSDIPDFRLNGYGQYDLRAPHDENWVYQKAFPYIQSQERLIQEDYRNGCLRTDRSKATQSNLTGNISAIKDISTATAVTVVTAAGVAVAGGAVVAGKAIYNQFNKKKVAEEQENICKRLNSYKELIQCLLTMKHRTNSLYERDTELVQYSNNMDANNELSGKLRDMVRQVGVLGCIDKANSSIEACKSRAVALKIIDAPMKVQGVYFGTLGAYITDLENSINSVRNLHSKTKQLLDRNISVKMQAEHERNMVMQHEYEQEVLIGKLTTELDDLITIVSGYKQSMNDDSNADFVYAAISNSDLANRINNASNQLDTIDDSFKRGELRDKVIHLNEDVRDIVNNIDSIRKQSANQIRNDINNELRDAERALDSLINGSYDFNDLNEIMQKINDAITHGKEKSLELGRLGDSCSYIVESRASALEEKLNKNRRSIDDSRREVEKQFTSLSKLDMTINKYLDECQNSDTSKKVRSSIENFTRACNSDIYFIKNTDVLEHARTKINDAKEQLEEIYNTRVQTEEQLKNQRTAAIANAIQEIEDKIKFIEEFKPSIIKESDIDKLRVASREEYEEPLRLLNCDYDELRLFRSKHQDLSSAASKKRRTFEDILNAEKRATNNLKNTINSIKNRINGLDKYSKDTVKRSIMNMTNDTDIDKLQDKEWVYIAIDELNQLYNAALTRLE